ncbi:MAG: hypothetical protein ACPGMR_11565 [Pontibacterium sp.]
MAKKLAALLALTLASSAHAFDYKAEMKKDRVIMTEKKMLYSQLQRCKDSKNSVQVLITSEAPNDGTMSRDFFIGFTSAREFKIYELVKDRMRSSVKCTPINNPIGEPDVVFNLYLSAEGYKISGMGENQTVLWSDLND